MITKTEIKRIHSLSKKKYRKQFEKFIIEGIHPITEAIKSLWKDVGGIRSVEWDTDGDDEELLKVIAEFSLISAKGRAYLEDDIWREEDAMRLSTRLEALARGRALLNGRTQINRDDVAMVTRVALDTMPHNRRRIFRALLCVAMGSLYR